MKEIYCFDLGARWQLALLTGAQTNAAISQMDVPDVGYRPLLCAVLAWTRESSFQDT